MVRRLLPFMLTLENAELGEYAYSLSIVEM